MKRLLLLIAFAFCVFTQVFAQGISFSPATAGRGDRVRFTIEGNSGDFVAQSVSIGIPIITQNSTWWLMADSAVIINDSVIKGAIDIPRYIANGPYTIDVSLISPFQYFGIDSGLTISGGVTKPEIISMTPSQGGRGDSIDFAIITTGTYFTQLDSSDISIYIWDTTSSYIDVKPITILNDSQLQGAFRIPRYFKDGPLQLQVYTPDDNTMIKSGGFLVSGGINLPYLESISQTTGGRGDSLSFLMHFKHTLFETTFQDNGWNSVNFLDTSGRYFNSYDIDLIDDTTLSIKVAVPRYYADGAFTISISVPDEGLLFISDGFSIIGGVAIPQIVSATPDHAQRGTYINFEVHTTGTRLDMIDPNVFSLSFAEQWFQFYPVSYEIVDSVTITGKLLITKNFPDATTLDVVINDVLHGSMILENVLEINGGKLYPQLVSVTPSILNKEETVDLYLTGLSTDFDLDSVFYMSVSGNGGTLDVQEYEAIDSNTMRIKVEVPAFAESGYYNIFLSTDLDGGMELYAGLWVNPDANDPAIVSFNPDVLIKGATMDITIVCANTGFINDFDSVYFFSKSGAESPVTLNTVEVLSNTELLCNVTVAAMSLDSFCGISIYSNSTGLLIHNIGIKIVNTAVREYAGMENIAVYPNPSSGNVYFKPGSSDPVKFIVMNITGQVVFEGEAVKQAEGTSLLFNKDECGIPGGMYFVTLSQGDQTYHSRILLE